ncbi:MAG: diadenylate cyclase CdaA [Ignavibacteriales bacterium]
MIELFKVGFISVTLLDLVDILIVTAIIYNLYRILKGTVAAQIFIGLIVVLLLSFIAQVANLKAVGWLLKLITDIWVIAFIILFQPEIRRLLVLLGKSPIARIFSKPHRANISEIVAEAAYELSQNQHGALIVIVRTSGIQGIAETGEIVNAKVNKNLIKSIFFPRSPLHDGAVIINNDIVEAVRCTLPLSSEISYNGIPLGMRHRAALGVSEMADVVCIIVSEETAAISIADNGKLYRGMSKESLKKYLFKNVYNLQNRGFKGIFAQLIKKEN